MPNKYIFVKNLLANLYLNFDWIQKFFENFDDLRYTKGRIIFNLDFDLTVLLEIGPRFSDIEIPDVIIAGRIMVLSQR